MPISCSLSLSPGCKQHAYQWGGFISHEGIGLIHQSINIRIRVCTELHPCVCTETFEEGVFASCCVVSAGLQSLLSVQSSYQLSKYSAASLAFTYQPAIGPGMQVTLLILHPQYSTLEQSASYHSLCCTHIQTYVT